MSVIRENGDIKEYHTGLILDFSDIPKRNYQYDWKDSGGHRIGFEYKNKKGYIDILEYDNGKLKCYNPQYHIAKWIVHTEIIKGKFLKFVNGSMKLQQKYWIGDIIQTNKQKLKVVGISVRRLKNSSDNKNISRIWYRLMCCNCKQCFWRSSYEIDSGCGCPICYGSLVIPGHNDIPTTAPWMIPYFQGGEEEARKYTKHGGHSRIIPVCPYCGRIHDKSVYIHNLYHNHGFKCRCSDGISYPEKFVMSFLKQLSVPYIHQAQKDNLPFDALNKIYDFYINDKNCIIEAHGNQHYEDANIFFTTLQHQQENDLLKYNLAKDYVADYIVLDCRYSELDWIKNSIMESKLPFIFDFTEDMIDWQQCAIDATKNLVKEVCDYYNEHDVNPTELQNYFSLGRKAIHTYLKRGAENGWCLYSSYTGFFSSQPLEVYKDGVFICNVKGLKSLSRNSEKLLGISISDSSIRKALNKNTDFHGYSFKLITDLQKKRYILCNNEY